MSDAIRKQAYQECAELICSNCQAKVPGTFDLNGIFRHVLETSDGGQIVVLCEAYAIHCNKPSRWPGSEERVREEFKKYHPRA